RAPLSLFRHDGLLQARVHDVALRCISDEVEGEAGDQRERWGAPRPQDPDVLRADDLDPVDDVRGLLLQRRELHHVSHDDVLESTEDAVSMPGDPDIAVFPRRRGPADPTDPAIQSQLVSPLEDRGSQVDLCDAQYRQGEALLDQQTLYVLPNARFRP